MIFRRYSASARPATARDSTRIPKNTHNGYTPLTRKEPHYHSQVARGARRLKKRPSQLRVSGTNPCSRFVEPPLEGRQSASRRGQTATGRATKARQPYTAGPEGLIVGDALDLTGWRSGTPGAWGEGNGIGSGGPPRHGKRLGNPPQAD
jgi:hypothetical protein